MRAGGRGYGMLAVVIEVIPVVEMEGFSYSERPVPDSIGSRISDPDAWDRYRGECLADAGLTGLTPIAPGSSLVPVTALYDRAIERLVAFELEAYDLELSDLGPRFDVEDTVTGISGGLVLRHDGVIVAEPGCCCGLDSLAEWDVASQAAEWRDVWIGHDRHRLEMRRIDGQLHLRWGMSQAPDWRGQAVVDAEVMQALLLDVRAKLAGLAVQIMAALPPMVGEAWREPVAHKLAGT